MAIFRSVLTCGLANTSSDTSTELLAGFLTGFFLLGSASFLGVCGYNLEIFSFAAALAARGIRFGDGNTADLSFFLGAIFHSFFARTRRFLKLKLCFSVLS